MVKKNFFDKYLWPIINHITASSLLIALLLSSLPILPLYAKKKDEEQKMVDESNTGLGNIATQTMQVMLNSMQQQQQNLANAQQMSTIATQYAPKQTDALYFPHCRIAFSTDEPPKNVCTSSTQIQILQAYQQAAGKQMNHLNDMSRVDHNQSATAMLKGLQCIASGQKDLNLQITNKINLLKNHLQKIRKEAQLFRDNSKLQIFDPLENINSELYGNGDSIDDKTRNFNDLFGNTTCPNVLSAKALEGKRGLIGIREHMLTAPQGGDKGMYQSAVNFEESGKFQLENEMAKKVARIKKEIERNGISQWIAKKDNFSDIEKGLNKYSSFNSDIEDFNTSFAKKYVATKEKIKNDLGYELPDLAKDFDEILSSFSGDAEQFFEKRFVNECVTGKGDTGIGLSYDQILRGFKQPSSRNRSTTTTVFKRKLSNILSSDAGIEDLMGKINSLDSYYNPGSTSNVIIDLKQEFGGKKANHQWTATELFRQLISECKGIYKNSNIYSYNNQSSLSYASKVKRAIKNIDELLAEQKTFVNDLTTTLNDKFLRCEGVSEPKCDANAFNSTSTDQYCVKHLSTCATKINSCYDVIKHQVNTRIAKSKQLSQTYNNNVESFIANQDNQIKRLSAQVFADLDVLKGFFQEGYELPELFIKMPEFEKSNGVNLRGGTDMAFLENLPERIEALIAEFEMQRDRVDKTIDDYETKQLAAMKRNYAMWGEFMTQCQKAEVAVRNAAQVENDKQKEKYGEQIDKINEFCMDYQAFVNVPGCDGDLSAHELYRNMMGVSSNLDKSVAPTIKYYANICYKYNNEKDLDEGDDSKYGDDPLERLCSKGGDGLYSYLKNKLKKAVKVSTVDTEWSDVLKYVNGDTDKLPEEFDDLEGLADAAYGLQYLKDSKTPFDDDDVKLIKDWSKSKGKSEDKDCDWKPCFAVAKKIGKISKKSDICDYKKFQLYTEAMGNIKKKDEPKLKDIKDEVEDLKDSPKEYPKKIRSLNKAIIMIQKGTKNTDRIALEDEWSSQIHEGGTVKCQAINGGDDRNSDQKGFLEDFERRHTLSIDK